MLKTWSYGFLIVSQFLAPLFINDMLIITLPGGGRCSGQRPTDFQLRNVGFARQLSHCLWSCRRQFRFVKSKVNISRLLIQCNLSFYADAFSSFILLPFAFLPIHKLFFPSFESYFCLFTFLILFMQWCWWRVCWCLLSWVQFWPASSVTPSPMSNSEIWASSLNSLVSPFAFPLSFSWGSYLGECGSELYNQRGLRLQEQQA